MGNYIKIEIETASVQQLEILIAELSEINYEAFEEEENVLSAFIKEEFFNEVEINKILIPKNIHYAKLIIEETNWNTKWESEFEPVVVENFVAIRAAFHKPIYGVKHEIIITPKMSFGTGHHATTYLMLQQMQYLSFLDKTVLDFGTGTGILAILAKKLGAKRVIAIDNDEWSINNAKENFVTNNCSDVVLLQKDNLNNLEIFDIILANINLNVVTNSIEGFSVASHQSSHFLLSGFLSSDEPVLIDAFSKQNFKNILTSNNREWISMLLTKA